MLNETLNWLTSADGGALVIVLWAVSWGLEDVEAWHNLSSKARQGAILVVSAVVAIGAVMLQRNPQWIAAIEPYFGAVAYVILGWVATQSAHKANKWLAKDDEGGGS